MSTAAPFTVTASDTESYDRAIITLDQISDDTCTITSTEDQTFYDDAGAPVTIPAGKPIHITRTDMIAALRAMKGDAL